MDELESVEELDPAEKVGYIAGRGVYMVCRVYRDQGAMRLETVECLLSC